MSDADAKAELARIHAELLQLSQAIQALKYPTSLIDSTLILSNLLKKELVKVGATEMDLNRVLTEVRDLLHWLRKNVVELNRLLSAVVTLDEPKNGG